MENYLLEWLGLGVRWLHMIAGIAWIGASFYFVWLNNNVRKPDEPNAADGEKDGELRRPAADINDDGFGATSIDMGYGGEGNAVKRQP